jgi:ribosomal protein RSM22 (predicted rRNA methylase)
VIASTPISARLAVVAEAAIEIASRRHRSPLAADVARLSSLFTGARGQRRPTYMQDPAIRRAYLGFFVPHNVARIALLLCRAADEGHLDFARPPRVLDVGAGPLSGLLACWAVWGRLGPSRAVDLSKGALDDGAALVAAVGADVDHLDLVDRSLTGPPTTWLPDHAVDVVVAANVLNELGDPREPAARLRLVQTLLRASSPEGRVLVVEPAMRVEARSLMAVRDGLVEQQLATVMSPCRGAPRCPLLVTRGDWCHGDVVWHQRPAAYRALERATGLAKEELAASHLLLARTGAPAPSTGLRIVGGTMRDALGTERRYACGRELVTVVGTPRLPAPVGRAIRGDVVADVGITPSPEMAPRGPPGRNAGGARGRPPPQRPRRGRGT